MFTLWKTCPAIPQLRVKAVNPLQFLLTLLLSGFCAFILLSPAVTAQTRVTGGADGYTPAGMATGAPANSYALSGFDNVNLYSGNLNFSLPLLRIGGRGQAGYTMSLTVEPARWRVWHFRFYQPYQYMGGDDPAYSTYSLVTNWWKGPEPGLGAGVLVGRRSGRVYYRPSPLSGNPMRNGCETLTRLSFIAPDGTETVLRNATTDGDSSGLLSDSSPRFNRGTIFISRDGSGMTFISDAPVEDMTVPASVTIAAGASSASFNITTLSVNSTASVTITAFLNSIQTAATLTLNPAPATADTVNVTLAQYETSKRTLRVEATSTRSNATLQVFVTAGGQLIGTLTNNGGGKYTGQFNSATNPQSITVRSSAGGSATRTVVAK